MYTWLEILWVGMNLGDYRPNASLYRTGWGLGGLSGLQDSGRHVHSQSFESPGLRHHVSHHFFFPPSRSGTLPPSLEAIPVHCTPAMCPHRCKPQYQKDPEEGEGVRRYPSPTCPSSATALSGPIAGQGKKTSLYPSWGLSSTASWCREGERGDSQEPQLPREEENLG